MTNLVLDFGNTRIKAGCFEHGKMTHLHYFSAEESLLNEKAFISSFEKIILTSVTNEHLPFIQQWKSFKPITVFGNSLKTPLKNLYKTPETLGSDRLLASIGAYLEFPNQPVLTIDFGTCIKYNFTNASNEFLGGAISPGIRMRYRALNEYTAKLPLLKSDFNHDNLIGANTESSLHSGVIIATLQEVTGMIASYESNFAGLVKVFTGGDHEFFAKRLKSSIFTDPHLVMKGLNHVLNYQIES
jgi:type III pantothenate kinase